MMIHFRFWYYVPFHLIFSPFFYISILATCRNATLQGLLTPWLHVTRFRPHIFFLFMSTPVGCGSFQARGQIQAAAAGPCHSHSNARSKLHLWPLTHWVRPGIEPALSQTLCWVLNLLSHNRNSYTTYPLSCVLTTRVCGLSVSGT